MKACVINGYEIEDMIIHSCRTIGLDLKFDNLFKSKIERISADNKVNIELKRSKLIELLKKNRVPIDEAQSTDDVISIMDTVLIRSPFEIENCESTNEIVLNKITNLLGTI
jgi:hypothetical protein